MNNIIIIPFLVTTIIMVLSVLKIIKSIYYLFSDIDEYFANIIIESDSPIIQLLITIVLFIFLLFIEIPSSIYMFILYFLGFKSCRACEKYIYPFGQKVKIYETGCTIDSIGHTDYYHKIC
jgi:hypothetical protein